MEILIFGIIIFVIWLIVNADNKAKAQAARIAELIQFRLRATDINLGEENDGPPAKQIEIKGGLPVKKKTNVDVIISVLDKTNGVSSPVFCPITELQEPETPAYYMKQSQGEVSPEHYLPKFSSVGVVIPEILVGPYSGKRNFVIVVYLIDSDTPPTVYNGFISPKHPGFIKHYEIKFIHTQTEKGYREEAEHRKEAEELMIKIAINMAHADGFAHKNEGALIQEWIKQTVVRLDEAEQDKRKSELNRAVKEGFAAHAKGELILSALIARLNKVSTTKDKYEAYDLCAKVLVADGIADDAEVRNLNHMARQLDIDLDSVQKIRNQIVIQLDPTKIETLNVMELLDIDPTEDKETMKKKLNNEYRKWNGYQNALNGDEREAAEKMLGLIAKARSKYAK